MPEGRLLLEQPCGQPASQLVSPARISEAVGSGYSTDCRHRPRGGAVGPAYLRSRLSSSSGNVVLEASRPRPTCWISVPAIFRTI